VKIVFDRVGATAKPFEVNLEGVKLEGTLKKSGSHQVTLDAHISGCIELDCDRCGDTYNYDMENELHLKLSDQISEDKDDLDIIEFLDGEIDLSYILQSEIDTCKNAYNYCPKCDNNDEDFEVEY
jgi:uncharacterized metal-binding protein YceD (DUF177 family)